MSDPEPSGPFPNWDDPTWDRPVRLFDAIKLWSPEFGSRLREVLDEAGEVSVDEIRRAAEQRRQREAGANAANATPDADGGPSDHEIPASLRDDFLRFARQWPHSSQTDRLAATTELAGRLIIEKTKHGEPFLLAQRSSASRGDLVSVDDAEHLSLGPFDFDLWNSTIRGPGQNWPSVWVLGGGATEGQRMRVTRLTHEAQDAAAAAAWAAERAKPMRKRQFFRYGDIADALATNPELEIDTAKRGRILTDLTDWTSRGEFDLSGDSEVVTLIGEPPYFVPLTPVGPDGILVDPEGLILRRRACRRYLENSALECAPRLLVLWFPPTAGGTGVVDPLASAADHEAEQGDPGAPKTGERCEIAVPPPSNRSRVAKVQKSAVVKAQRRERLFWSDARAVAMQWLQNNGYPQPGDGGQAGLERHIADWLSRGGNASGEATVRRHVQVWIKEYREKVGA
jgi:hypothetical protein